MIYAHVAQKKPQDMKSTMDVMTEKSTWNKNKKRQLKGESDKQQHLWRLSWDKSGQLVYLLRIEQLAAMAQDK
jgi:hypothetical protein